MDIYLHNTKSRKKELLEPVTPGRVGMYVCGPTVYDRAHIGNARPVIVFDVLYRLLRHVYGPENVRYVRNFTDVDDKIIARAEESGREIGQITEETSRWYLEDMAAVGALEPTDMPRATEWIGAMVEMIEGLISGGHAYAAEGHVLFRVRSYEAYGALSGRSVDDMIAGARVEVAPYKEDPMDFVLWKPAKEGEPGWDSPWGKGRPGWHIECSAMADALLGETFDIHGGGNDLMFPHHENEIAQSKCAHPDGEFARIWMHNEMLQVEGKKMSKSLGNFFTVRDLLDQGVPGEVIRFVFLGTHYRKPMDWTEKKRQEAEATLLNWRTLIARLGSDVTARVLSDPLVSDRFLGLLADDLNTPGARTVLSKLASEVRAGDVDAARKLVGSASLLGINLNRDELISKLTEQIELGASKVGLQREYMELIDHFLDLRKKAKANKDFQEADRIRAALTAADVEVVDTPDGPTWTLGAQFDSSKLEALK